ncbi:hypothetical protein PENSPDRAFT_650026 [Peniophora sp. CONT]|nr:hypothetical protein PENSPDRAFT_650026 [Peniophora sp. CONT]
MSAFRSVLSDWTGGDENDVARRANGACRAAVNTRVWRRRSVYYAGGVVVAVRTQIWALIACLGGVARRERRSLTL